jgi:hypothetical protein
MEGAARDGDADDWLEARLRLDSGIRHVRCRDLSMLGARDGKNKMQDGRNSPPAMPIQNCQLPLQAGLFADAELLNHVFVRLGIVALEVVKQTTTSADHHEKTATGRVILLMGLEMFGQFADPFAQDCYLNLWATGVRGMRAILADNALFFLGC